MIIDKFSEVGDFGEDKDISAKLIKEKIDPCVAALEEVILNVADVTLVTQSFIHALISDILRTNGEAALDYLDFRSCADVVRGIVETVVQYSLDSLDEEREEGRASWFPVFPLCTRPFDAGRSLAFGARGLRGFGGVLIRFRRPRWKRSAQPGSSSIVSSGAAAGGFVGFCMSYKLGAISWKWNNHHDTAPNICRRSGFLKWNGIASKASFSGFSTSFAARALIGLMQFSSPFRCIGRAGRWSRRSRFMRSRQNLNCAKNWDRLCAVCAMQQLNAMK
jgi:uncharacterized protein DUF4325